MKTSLNHNQWKEHRKPDSSGFQKFFQKIKNSIKSSHALSLLLGEYLDETDEQRKKKLSYSINSRFKKEGDEIDMGSVNTWE